ncbi:uncharacterized protein LOC122092306 [Macadamia integrifolia]|uniref:uncharacterized protein LOC122092306 n=1 Tax=Macadamia integrifolia TaxID=60698 RepID=UPI001C52B330|nr:uncharacterized protein LOC122092306 [Macadamia integrifolia]
MEELVHLEQKDPRAYRKNDSKQRKIKGMWGNMKAYVVEAVSSGSPIVGMLKMVDSTFKPNLPSLWVAIAIMKENVYAANPRGSRKFVKIIEDYWERQLSHPLHKATYYLNPRYQYTKRLALDPDLLQAVKHMVAKLQLKPDLQDKAKIEMKEFRDALGSFGALATYLGRKITDLAEWWVLYGGSAPELRKIAIKVLSQTCSASGYERN